jgi:hypothetical protein
MLTRDSDFLEKRKGTVCFVRLHLILKNGRKPWDGGLLQGVYGSPASCFGRGILTRDSDLLKKRKKI